MAVRQILAFDSLNLPFTFIFYLIGCLSMVDLVAKSIGNDESIIGIFALFKDAGLCNQSADIQ